MLEVGVKINEAQSIVSTLRSSTSSIQINMSTNRSFTKTNITPFTKDLEKVIRAVELLKQYRTLLISDIDILEQTIEKIRENDERISKTTSMTSDGPRPLFS